LTTRPDLPSTADPPQGYRKRHMNVLGPAVGPTTANGVVAAFLLGHAK
jgi:hypothetical protein